MEKREQFVHYVQPTDLSAAHKDHLEELKECREKVKKLDAVHRQVEKVLAPEQEKQQSKKKNMEL